MRYFKLGSVLLLVLLFACTRGSMMKAMASPEDEQVAKGYIELLRQNDLERIERDTDPSIRSANIHDTLAKMAGLIPAQDPQSVKVVGSNTLRGPDFYKTNITFEYQFPGQWLLINVAIQKKGGMSTIVGFNVDPIPDSLENINRFTLSGKSTLQYAVLAFAVVVPLFSLYALVLCVRTKIEKRKWLWIVFIIFGIGKFSIDWISGQWGVMPLVFQLFGVGVFAPQFGPWILSVSLPLGAIMFLLRRRRFDQQAYRPEAF